ncbi:hypothetical protein I3760_08G170000 [Carya illinoinensis]|uniref:KIB1-4 beta-propeller domain-containing protein n=1 Tax=Carya illinoinensis TaxID=32201 RepID=A0A922EDI2_CARIL|nr:hypothetical protein I3760_08G170000 [Carya illinoinensis]KAG6701629.1 hypothetical protein I3842_08G174700 [Carya illinoinensis]
MGERVVDWSDFPKELWSPIGKSLDTGIDVLRFRSVCSSWRASIPPSHPNSPRFPLQFPHPYDAFPTYICQSTIYCIQPLDSSSTSTAATSSHIKGDLIKVQESASGKLRLLEPLASCAIHSYPRSAKTLNLLNFRIVEITKAYTLRFGSFGRAMVEDERRDILSYRSVPGVNKVVMFPNSAWTNAEGCAIFVIFLDGKLGFAKYGEDKLTLVDDQTSDYDDIIVYKGQFYVVDRLGVVFWIECSSLKLVQFSPPLCGLGSRKHLVESCGALYVVDEYLDRERGRMEGNRSYFNRRRELHNTIDFKVYKLDEEWGQWVLVKCLGDRAFILGSDCNFSVSAQEFVGCKRNRIYFMELEESRAFNLEDHRICDLAFSPDPPSWLYATNPLM